MRSKRVLTTRVGPVSRRRALWEAHEARARGLSLPPGHPYQFLPTVTPYWLAKLIVRLAQAVRPRKSHPA